MANLGLIHFWIGLPININANEGQNKFEVHILQNVAKMTNYTSKIGQDATLAILTFEKRQNYQLIETNRLV